MYHAQHAIACHHHANDQLSISRHAAKAAEHMQAIREQRMARKAQRKARAGRSSQESYTTAF